MNQANDLFKQSFEAFFEEETQKPVPNRYNKRGGDPRFEEITNKKYNTPGVHEISEEELLSFAGFM